MDDDRNQQKNNKSAELQKNGQLMKRPSQHASKVFRPRESLFNQLYESNYTFRALYLLCASQMIMGVLIIVLRDSFKAGRPYIDLKLMHSAFGFVGDWWNFAVIEVLQLAGFLLIYPVFKTWVFVHGYLHQLADALFIGLYVAYVLVSGYFAHTALIWADLPPIFKLVTSIEHMRIVLKSYSFVRENVYKVIYPWNKEDTNGLTVMTEGQLVPKVGSFNQYFYFLFAPTLMYRDHYPRNQGPVQWKRALRYWIEFLTVNYVVLIMAAEFMFPASMRLQDMLSGYLGCLGFSIVLTFLASADILQLWQNFAAELTRFADREFYTDWWTSTNYSTFYRKWNNPIHDWVHAYLYRDIKALTGSKLLGAIPVFTMSSLMHEFHLAAALGFFTPVFLIFFGLIGNAMFLVRPKRTAAWQMFTVTGVGVGTAIFIVVYSTEMAARRYCPYPPGEEPTGLGSYFTYRTPYCYAQFN